MWIYSTTLDNLGLEMQPSEIIYRANSLTCSLLESHIIKIYLFIYLPKIWDLHIMELKFTSTKIPQHTLSAQEKAKM